MAATYRDRVKVSISNTPGANGNLTVSTAVTKFQGFTTQDIGLLFDILIEDGSTWEIRKEAAYNGTSLVGGTFMGSSSGSPISLTSASVVSVTLIADKVKRINGRATAIARGFAMP